MGLTIRLKIIKVYILCEVQIKKSLTFVFFLFGVERDQSKHIYRLTIL